MDKLIARTTVSPGFFNESEFPVRTNSLRLEELPLSGIIRIQGKSEDGAIRLGVASAVGVPLPGPERVSEGGDVQLAWAGPNECLCFCPLASEERYATSLVNALAGQFATVTIVSDSRVAIQVSGADAAALLASGCAIDVHPSSFEVGHVVITRFAGLPAMMMHPESSEYVLYFDVSATEYVVTWLLKAAEEFVHQTS
ncbi:sarcosine oxidase subunit gamma [Paraburkholderia oxyphila]|uniref:sarcosine oxidase subunit gamma n=1 Tax=Paraburkholderia oxyphila TaxID=614212 RepID=UPI0004831C8F|nr:sarcosine oxidase subunit gamma family protein [Paraburkholderia oxyphila]